MGDDGAGDIGQHGTAGHAFTATAADSSGATAAADSGAAAAAAELDAIPREPLLLAEKQELCVAESKATQQEVEEAQAGGELDRACALAAIADCQTFQAGEVARDTAALLALLGLPAEPAKATASPDTAEQRTASDVALCQESQGAAAPPPMPPANCGGLRLPTARELAQAELHGARFEQLLGDMLGRQNAAATRLQLRCSMLQVRWGGGDGQARLPNEGWTACS